ncbi:MAG: hypothetical protein E7282_00600 [Lachnospiraceae bacterium]|uniref:Uncharacterized protein n=2 Tax=Agathobacter ruminis TaxID=1712665 RepID=A0A2G3E1E4_9FIRM|nr:hypothetical protein [Lachnospiraceae bacterium]MDC7300383.1 hypothetical protein [Agathobacter ruminis]PHU37106.1 hypothetical protein CSX02_09660 [Agathobacter ruminis]
MGLFGSMINKAKEQYQAQVAQMEANAERERMDDEKNMSRPSIRDLAFDTLGPAVAEQLENAKVGLLDKGLQSKFVEQIKAANVGYKEVLVLDYTIALGGDGVDGEFVQDKAYIKPALLDGTVLKEDVFVLRRDYKFDDYDEDVVGDTGNADVVSSNLYHHMYILHYFLGKKEYYAAVHPDEFKDLTPLIGELNFVEDDLGAGTGYQW